MNDYDLIVFDWDGTLSDSTALIRTSIQRACADLELPVPSDAAALHVIGLGLHDALRFAVPTLTPEQLPGMVERYRHHYLSREAEVSLFTGVHEMLSALKSRQRWLAIATGKNRAGLDRALKSTGLGPFFDATRTADEGFPKPHPDMLNVLCGRFGVEPRRTLMVGDTSHDLLMASNAACDAVAVTYGAHQHADLQKLECKAICADVHGLTEWLLGHV